ncbi:hypothetical protein OPV22_026484 [Ensete ventricosum]|uniref:Phosphofructokinase domain-containing protein n=1 Tax=Ensete ventricosum TaxID=4639 RepID=A0AAV8P8J6_ENSVE|nr:hypothetical protein OPV22_026484 [Ensete ventricosum]
MNTVIRELVVGPWELYGVRHIFDVSMDPKIVHGWHRMGDGTALAMSRAGSSMPSKRAVSTREGKGGLFEFLDQRLKYNGHAVVVIAEGAGQGLIPRKEGEEVDESGNPVFLDVGTWLKSELNKWWKEEHAGQLFTVKYIDPMYMIRAVPANAIDNLCCTILVLLQSMDLWLAQ